MKKLLLIILLIVGCEEENSEVENFNGITEIDIEGNIISEDSNDWCGEYILYSTDCPTEIEIVESLGTPLIPAEYSLSPAYPNPFDSLATIYYGLPESPVVTFKVIDSAGNTIRNLGSAKQEAGYYCISWDGRNDNGDIVESDLYRVFIYANHFSCSGDLQFSPN
tara:strand:+ start:11 stop:505 length:495 start_codon:yes stop_codon:yes gene_type:complete